MKYLLLKDILYKVAIEAVKGSTEIVVNKIEFDSRKVQENDVFVAIRGTVSNGHDFIEKAINLGAVAIVCDTLPKIIVTGSRWFFKDSLFLTTLKLLLLKI